MFAEAKQIIIPCLLWQTGVNYNNLSYPKNLIDCLEITKLRKFKIEIIIVVIDVCNEQIVSLNCILWSKNA